MRDIMAELPETFSNDGLTYETSSQGTPASYYLGYQVEEVNSRGRVAGDVTPTDAYGDDYSGAGLRLIDQEGVYQLTQDLRNFSDTLTSLKSVFCEERESLDQSLRVVAHERLGELLKVLKTTVNKYEELDSTGILNAAENLINHIKNFNYECVKESVPPEIFGAINNLALAFSSSVSECLIGDINISPRHSLEIQSQGGNRNSEIEQASVTSQRSYADDTNQDDILSPGYIEGGDSRIPRAESHASTQESVAKNLEVTFDRAKTWSKYANDLLTFIKKRSHIELEYANKLAKLSQTTRAVLSEQSFLPFQSLYCTLFDNDKEYASSLTSMYQNHLLAQKFFDPLNATRQEHDRSRKVIREAWRKEKRRLEESESNLRKAKQNYNTRHLEYQKAKDAKLKADQQLTDKTLAEGSHSRQASGNSNQVAPAGSTLGLIGSGTSKIEKRRKHEDDSYNKAVQAEQYYRACVHDTEQRRRDLEKKEEELLDRLRQVLTVSDQATKRVTLSFFQAHCDLTSPIRIQYQALLDESKSYEPGFQYTEYLRHLVPHQSEVALDNQVGAYHNENDGFGPMQGGHDTDSSSTRSVDDPSPAPSPAIHNNRKVVTNLRRASTEGSLSSDEILDDGKETADQNRTKPPSLKESSSGLYPDPSSPANLRPQFQRPKVMKMVDQFKGAFIKGMRKMPKATVFGIDYNLAAQDSPDSIPMLVKRCIAEIENRGIEVKGIYRVNGVKNRIEKICALLDSVNCARVDLSEHSPHDISGVLKYFLRQLPEPLVPYDLYVHFLEVAKEYTEITKAHRLASPEGDKTADDIENDLMRSLQPCIDRMRVSVERLPSSYSKALYFLMAHLFRVSQHHSENKMTASNLGIIFGPTLLRPRPSNESGNELLPLLELPNQSQAIEMLISYHREIWLPQKIEAEESKTPTRGPQAASSEDALTSESEEFREGFSQSKSHPSPFHRSSEFLSTERMSPTTYDVTSSDVPNTTISESHQNTSSRSSLTSSSDVISPRPESYLEGNPRMELNNDASYVTNDRRTIIPHRASVTKISAQQTIEGLMPKELGTGGRQQEMAEQKRSLDDLSCIVKNSDTSAHSTRRPSIRNLPFLRTSLDSSKNTYDTSASLGKTSDDKEIHRRFSVDANLDNAMSSHRPRSQRIFPGYSERHRIRRSTQLNSGDSVITDIFEGSHRKGDKRRDKKECDNEKSTRHSDKTRTSSPKRSAFKIPTMPGRTPPLTKSVCLSLSKNLSSLDEPVDRSKLNAIENREKLRLDLDSADDSFC